MPPIPLIPQYRPML